MSIERLDESLVFFKEALQPKTNAKFKNLKNTQSSGQSKEGKSADFLPLGFSQDTKRTTIKKQQVEEKTARTPTINFDQLNIEGEDTDLIGLHLKEIKDRQINVKSHPKLASQIFVGQLAIKALKSIAESDLVTSWQKDGLAKILEDKKTKFLSEQFDLNLNNLRNRTKRNGSSQKEKDIEFIQINDKHSEWVKRQIEKLEEINNLKVRGHLLQRIIDRMVVQVERGKKSFGELVEHNLALAVHWANVQKCNGLSFSERLSFAQEGLMYAAARFDFRRKNQFTTYATWWIKQKIERAIMDFGSVIRLPTNIYEDYFWKYLEAEARLAQELGYIPSLEDIANELGITKDKLSQLLQTREVSSLNRLVGENEDEEWINYLEDANSQDLDDEVFKAELRKKVKEVLQELSFRERRVMELRFGIVDGERRSLSEVGREFKVSRERIRQIEMKALKRLADPKLKDKLLPYLEVEPKAIKINGANNVNLETANNKDKNYKKG